MRFMLGVDEAGRGPLAGPVAAGVVMVPEGFDVARKFIGVADSKKLSEKKREEIFTMLEACIVSGDVRFAVEFESAEVIDEKGIAYAVREAVARGINGITCGSPTSTNFHILLDGSLHAPPEYAQKTIINGDELIPIIALASIVAKVRRDRLMVRLAKQFPEYGFEQHKGYGTEAHYRALKKHGPCILHRQSFLH